jgi:enoyl-CoA hydratase
MSAYDTAWQSLKVERGEGFVTVRLDSPPVNAVSQAMKHELRAVFDLLSDDRGINSVILAAAGERAFCGGVDLREKPQDPDTLPVQTVLDPGWEWRAAQHAIVHCAVPVIAAVDRPAIGAGFGLVTCCDIIFASTTATFGQAEIKVGVLGGASKSARMLGPYGARLMFFTGDPMSAEELYRRGAVAEVTPSGAVEDRAQRMARQLAGYSPLALRLAKESLVRIEGDTMETQYRTEQDYTARLRGHEDSAEARLAYLEKRKPEWHWK